MKLSITGREKTVGTAANNGSVTILGRTKPFKIYLEGIKEALEVHPYVVRDLSHPLNLGQSFLRIHNADMSFRENGIRLCIKNNATLLESSDSCLTKDSIDTRIKQILDKFRDNGQNPWSDKAEILDLRINKLEEESEIQADMPGVYHQQHKKAINFEETTTWIHNTTKTLLKAGHTTVVTATRGTGHQPPPPTSVLNNDVMLIPKKTHKWMNRQQIFVHPGTYFRQGDLIKVMVSNFGHSDQHLPVKCQLGHILEAKNHTSRKINTLDHRPSEKLSKKEISERRSYIIKQLKLDDNQILCNTPEVKEQVIDTFLQGWDAIAISEADYGKTDLVKFHIEIPKGTRPVRERVRPLNPMQEQDLRRQIDDWLEARVIEPSCSPWASALVPCKKKGTDKYRWAIDYRKVNELTVKDAFPLANIENNLQKLAGTSIFSTLDSAGAFHTIPVHEEHRDYTAFNTPYGQYRFCRLPFGLANAPSAYSRLVQMALDRLPHGFALGYIDDIIVHSLNIQDHLVHLQQIVRLHVDVGMKLNLNKCSIFQTEVEYLGHLVSPEGFRMIPSYVQRILDWPLPKTSKELKSFLGFTGYYRSFITQYAHLTCEMNKMKTSTSLTWNQETTNKFERLKKAFETQPLRGYPQYETSEPFILDTDYSSTNLAAVLSQNQEGKEVFLGCVAKKCSKAQSSYPPHKGELAAVVLGLKKFEHILRAKPFTIRTDSKCVEFLRTMKEYRGIFARWLCFISSFTFTLVHRAGKKQTNADSLSRMPGLPEQEEVPLDPTEYLHDVDDIYVVQDHSNSPITREKLKTLYSQDMALSKLLPFLTKKVKPNKEERKTFGSIGMSYINRFECLELKEDIIYYTSPEVNGVHQHPRICLPVILYNTAFDLCHDDPSGTSGHFGMNITFHKMKRRFFFPHMYAFITARITNCVPCITKRPSLPKKQHVLHREQLSYFSQRVYCDIVGPLTGCSYHGKMCHVILTIQDGFTRYLVAVPLPDQKTETVINAIIENWIYVFGCMETLHTDRGTNFTSNLFKEVMHQLGITKTVTPAYTPESDRVERSHRVLGDLLRADKRFPASKWTEKLKPALLAYNSAINRVTGMSPFEAVFFRPVTLPVDLIFPLDKPECVSWSNHIENMKLKLSQQCETMCKIQQTTIARENQRYQARAKPPAEVGDICYYFLPRLPLGTSQKLSSRWTGPWKIVKVVSEALVIISPFGNWSTNGKEVATSVNKIKIIDPQVATHDITQPNTLLDLNEIIESDDGEEDCVFFEDPHENLTQEAMIVTENEEDDSDHYIEGPTEEITETDCLSNNTDTQLTDNSNYDTDTQLTSNPSLGEGVDIDNQVITSENISSDANITTGRNRPLRISAETCKLRIALQNERSKRKRK